LNLGYDTHGIDERAVERSRKRACNIHEKDPAAYVETVESSDCANSVWTQTDLSMQGIDEILVKEKMKLVI
jgi:hypothetical protein